MVTLAPVRATYTTEELSREEVAIGARSMAEEGSFVSLRSEGALTEQRSKGKTVRVEKHIFDVSNQGFSV